MNKLSIAFVSLLVATAMGCEVEFATTGDGAATADASTVQDSGTTPVICTTDSQCALGSYCANGACLPGCHSDVNCVAGTTCQSGACRPSGTPAVCTADSQCPADRICNATGACVVGCRSDANCVHGQQTCVNNVCQATTPVTDAGVVVQDSGVPANDGGPITGTHTLALRMGAARQASCTPSGLQIVVFDNGGNPLAGPAGASYTVRFGDDWEGFVNVGATCNGRYIDFSPSGRTAQDAGFDSIVYDGEELVRVALTCSGHGAGVKIQVPISAGTRGICR
jgi:hypothetical protein